MRQRRPGRRTNGFSWHVLPGFGPLLLLQRGDERTIEGRAGLISNEDMSLYVTTREARRTRVCGQLERTVTYHDIDCCRLRGERIRTGARAAACLRTAY